MWNSGSVLWNRVAGVVFVALTFTGCNRAFYRQQADRDVSCIVSEKSGDPRWGLPGFTIEQDPRSRYFEPYSQECPPMPEDDPAAHAYMHCVYGMKGWKYWHDTGMRDGLENPDWRAAMADYAPITEEGELFLSLDSALRVAYIHSPPHQQQLETLYLSALDVSTERFRLSTQFFGGNDTTFRHLGRLRPGGETNTLTTNTDFQMRRRFATAGELLVGFANSFVWQFAGPNTNSTLSILNFSLVQPLLRGAGRDIALEQLTIVERGLLSNLRAYQRYRQGFFTLVAVGELGVTGPNRRGGFFGGTGLTGFTGTGSGGLGGVGAATGFGRGTGGAGGGGGGGAGFAGGGAGQVGGFIGLLQASQEIRNTRISLNSQLRTLNLLESSLAAGVIDLTQVDQFRQNIETERAVLLQAENSLQNQLDTFKTQILGLPPDIPVKLDDSLIQPFQLIDENTIEVQNAIADLQDLVGGLPAEPSAEQVQALVQNAKKIEDEAMGVFEKVEADLDKLTTVAGNRKRGLESEVAQTFERDRQGLSETLETIERRFVDLRPRRETLSNLSGDRDAAKGIRNDLVVWLRDLSGVVQGVSLVQARARLESVYVDRVELSSEDAFQIAMENRLDLMNNRASLVDSWRLIQFNADALQSNLNVFFEGDLQTTGNNPVKFRGPAGSLRAGVQFDAPFTRLLERNNFRQQLIEYQQDRRQLIQFYDTTHQGLRQLLRQLEQLRVNLEIQRRAVVIAIRRVDLTRETLNEPQPPIQPGQPSSQLGPTAATNLLTALSDLRNTQNNFMSVYLNYYANRIRLDRELGIMALDQEGRWIDKPLPDLVPLDVSTGGTGAGGELPPEVPEAWIQEVSEPIEGAPAPEPTGESR